MKPHLNMTETEHKAYLDYVFSHELNAEENKAYIDYLSELEDRYGCDFSSIPIDAIEKKNDDEIWEMMLQERVERRKRNATR